MPDYTIRDPQSGKTLTVRGDSPPTEMELEELFAGGQQAPQAQAQNSVFSTSPKMLSQVRADDEANRARVAQVTEEHPYATAGVMALTGGAPGLVKSVARGGMSMAGRAASAGKAALGAAAPGIKYEVTKSILEGIGLPSGVALPVALAVSSRGGKSPAVVEQPKYAPRTPKPPNLGKGSPLAKAGRRELDDIEASKKMIEGMSAAGKPAPTPAIIEEPGRTYRRIAPFAKNARARYRELSTKTILTPQEAQELAQLEAVVKTQAQAVGTSYAAGGK
jgi:hypothetical protein